MEYEVLAPVGNIDDLTLMLDEGADAVYVGLKGVSSRPSNADLTLEEISTAIKKCHNYKKKIYIAINVKIGQRQCDDLLKKIEYLDEMNADAIILSDLGIIYALNGKLKNSKIHVSTLAGVYNSSTIKVLEAMGVTRIIFCANLKFEEMAQIISAVPNMEYEVVAEGGTCFNDICLCNIPHGVIGEEQILYCREKYELYDENICIGSAKSICELATKTDDIIPLFMAIGVKSYKIEGRTVRGKQRVQMIRNLKRSIENYKDYKGLSAYLHYFAKGFWR